jgi:hypothetical protein
VAWPTGYMEKRLVYLSKDELEALRKTAARSGRSVASVIRDAIRQVVPNAKTSEPVGLWDGEPKRTSVEHDGDPPECPLKDA